MLLIIQPTCGKKEATRNYYFLFFAFHTVHGVLKARILKWFAIAFFSGPCLVRTLHHDLSVFGGPIGLGSLFH